MLFRSTLKPNIIKENIYLFASLLKVSREISLDPKYKEEEFETIKDKNLSEAEKTEVLLNILFEDEDEKQIYRRRWDSVKDHAVFDKIKATKPTFKRGDYSMKKETAKMLEETSIEDRMDFIQEVKQEINKSLDVEKQNDQERE